MKLPKGMKAAVLHINSASAVATSPTMRIARYTAGRLGIPLIHDVASAAAHAKTKFDLLFVKLGVLKFSNHRDDALEIYANAKRICILGNDYSFKPDGRLKKLQPVWQVWSTVPDEVSVHGGAYVNWNSLTWLYPQPWAQRVQALRGAPGRMLYYGAARADRIPSFQKWLRSKEYEVVIGARSTHIKKFQQLLPGVQITNFRNPRELQEMRGTAIYLEDETSHQLYCSLANRFYECLQLGIPMIFDNDTRMTLYRAGLKSWRRYVVEDQSEAAELLKDPVRLARDQRALWYEDFDATLAAQFDAAVRTL